MKSSYTAKIYLGEDEILENSKNDIDELYAWMLGQAEGKFGNIHGEIIDNKTNTIVRKFRKAPPD